MLRFGADTGRGRLVGIGLEERNIGALTQGRPIFFPLSSVGVNVPGDVLIYYGRTGAELDRTMRTIGSVRDATNMVTDPVLGQEAAIYADHPKVLIVTVGLPRSGKSTWARLSTYPVVNPDSVRLSLHGQQYIEQSEPMVHVLSRYMVRALFLAGHHTVVLDATNVTRRRRDEWKDPEWATYFKVVDTSSTVCTERAVADGFPVGVVADKAAKFEQLGDDEPRWPA